MRFDAIVLAGGRSSRLGAGDKAELRYRGRSLVEHAVDAVREATTTVVVGPDRLTSDLAGVLPAIEEPRWAGPAAALAAGFDRLSGSAEAWVVTLACDLPHAPEAVAALLRAIPADGDGVIAVDESGRRQPLLAVYRTEALGVAVALHRADGPIVGLSLNRLIFSLDLAEATLDQALCADVDTAADAASWGIRMPQFS